MGIHFYKNTRRHFLKWYDGGYIHPEMAKMTPERRNPYPFKKLNL